MLESVPTAGSIVRLGLIPVTVGDEPELGTEEAEMEATLTPPCPDTRVTIAGVVEVPVFMMAVPSVGVMVTPPVLGTDSVSRPPGALVVIGLPPLSPMKAPQPPLTGRPPLRPTPPLHPVAWSGGAGNIGWLGLPPPPCCWLTSGLGDGCGWPGVFLPPAEPGVRRPAEPGVSGPWL